MRSRIIIVVMLMGSIFNAHGQSIDGESFAMYDYEKALMNDENTSGMLKGNPSGQMAFYYARMDEKGFDSNFFYGFELLSGQYISDQVFARGGMGFMAGIYEIKYDVWNYTTWSEYQLNIPLQVGLSLPFSESSYIDLYTGPRINYIISGKREDKSRGEKVVKTKYKDLDNLERFYVNWNIGASLCFGSWGITAEYRSALNDKFADYFHIGLFFSARNY